MKMKLFGLTNKAKHGVDASDLEQEVNTWLEEHPAMSLIEVHQSSNGGSWANTKIFISIWYEEA